MSSAYDRALHLVLRLSNDVDSWLKVFSVIKKHEPDYINCQVNSSTSHKSGLNLDLGTKRGQCLKD